MSEEATRLKDRMRALYERCQPYSPTAAFIFGVSLDAVSLRSFDQVLPLTQQGLYLLILTLLMATERREAVEPSVPVARSGALGKIMRYREELTHFFFGSLLSAYTVFFFKAASVLSSALFLVLVAGCLVANEFTAFRRLGIAMRSALLALCLLSYFCCVVPVLWGRIGVWPFLTSVAATVLALGILAMILSKVTNDRVTIRSRLIYPAGGVVGSFVLFYALGLIPPVPLSLGSVGIYHEVERVPGSGYVLRHERPAWRFWESGDQRFRARPGDRIYCFFSVIAPGGFKERLKVRWLYDHPTMGWTASDAIPVEIHGGREEGYRGFTFKRNYEPGDWQVRIETSDGREVGRISLTVELDALGEERRFFEEREGV